MSIKKIIIPIFLLLLTVACKKKELTPIADVDCTDVKFSTTIEPILSPNCYSCHGTTSSNGALSNYDEIKVYVDNGQFKAQVLTTQDMPRNKSLTSEQLGLIQCWLDAGAPDN